LSVIPEAMDFSGGLSEVLRRILRGGRPAAIPDGKNKCPRPSKARREPK
jgi:hypothetical protein